MNQETFKPKAYLKEGCPFSFKFLLFMGEARLLDRIEVIRCDPDDPHYAEVKAKIADATGEDATFPTVEIAPGRYRSDSDALIEHFANEHGVTADRLPILSYYRESLFPVIVDLEEENRRLRDRQG